MATKSYVPQEQCKSAINQVNDLAEFVIKFYPGEIGRGNIKEGETVVDVVKRLLSPTEAVNDQNSKVPNWAVDTLAKKELRRLSQYVMEKLPETIQEGGVVDNVIRLLQTAYADL